VTRARAHGVAAVSALLVAALALSACGTVDPSTALRNWTTSSNLSGAIASLTLDARHVESALRDARSSAAQLHTVCAVLDLETLQANAALPTPDSQTTDLLSAAYTDLGDAANVCYGAAASATKRQRALSYVQRAGAELSEASARVSSLGATS
jgi:hypothetical protein